MTLIRSLDIQPYLDVWHKMKAFTSTRVADTEDECWILQHFPVYTQGQAGKPEHLLHADGIPVVQSDRGGQITYHGPGQIVAYFLFDLRRRNLGIRTLVQQLEQMLIATLADFQIKGEIHCGAPGVYIGNKKIASIGLRVKNGCTYHGIALNVAMDLTPFKGINPCGYQKMEMAQMSDYLTDIKLHEVEKKLSAFILQQFDN